MSMVFMERPSLRKPETAPKAIMAPPRATSLKFLGASSSLSKPERTKMDRKMHPNMTGVMPSTIRKSSSETLPATTSIRLTKSL